ncbi:TIGR02588 family protein [Roseomonas sp. 18066]|uniref:TIGR02588 family protein n=1 Tax=Roseomonas sp. 18066 TaxID=2681412 RepID=UPI00135B2936|nr:TIGR02588 family protein [Roseomonas sp. 18066]
MGSKPALEWIMAAIGAGLTLATLAVVASDISASRGDPVPRLRIAAEAPRPDGQGAFLVRFTVTNAAPATAAQVTVEGVLAEGDRVLETSQVTLDYVPRGSSARGGLWFRQDPGGRLRLRVTGYAEP